MAGMVLFGAALGGGLALSWAFSYQRLTIEPASVSVRAWRWSAFWSRA